jgi:dihydroorotase
MKTIRILKPDDWHLHVRDMPFLKDALNGTTPHFARALLMPNLHPPLTKINHIQAYKEKVRAHSKANFTPFFTLYLTDATDVDTLIKARSINDILGAKLYPKGATTNSAGGVSSLKKLYPLFECMQENNLVLQIHGETTTDDIFYRERAFIENELLPLTKTFPKLKIVLEHISTKTACDFVKDAASHIAATITVHHLLYNRNDMLSSGLKPHLYCLPILKSEKNQQAVRQAALSGDPSFFLGTDSAPHTIQDKESACGCAGVYSAPYALPLYASFFDRFDALDKLQAFSSENGADFYGLPRNTETISLINAPLDIPETLPYGDKKIRPIAFGETINWRVDSE